MRTLQKFQNNLTGKKSMSKKNEMALKGNDRKVQGRESIPDSQPSSSTSGLWNGIRPLKPPLPNEP